MPTQHTLIDWLVDSLKLKNDAALANALEFAPPVISKIRNGKMKVGAEFLCRVSELMDLPVKAIRGKMNGVTQ